MANSVRILFVSDEVEPFSRSSATASLVRMLPELLQDTGEFELRIMMPRYGTISERKNRLHEVIRLSGTEIEMGSRKETLKVKVASIPGIRLQVYFMDNAHYFKRKGVYASKQGDPFVDNAERALFFARASLETIHNLGWGPDVVHAFGWMSGFVPMMLRTEYAGASLFENAKVVFTPNEVDVPSVLTEDLASTFSAHDASEIEGLSPLEVGVRYADSTIYPLGQGPSGSVLQFSDDADANLTLVRSIYEQVLSEVAA